MTEQKQPRRTKKPASSDLLRLTRLVVGGSIAGVEILQQQLRAWERELEQLHSLPPRAPTDEEDDAEPVFSFARPPAEESEADLLRYAFIGWLLEGEAQLQNGLEQVDRASRGFWRLVDPFTSPLRNGPLLRPLRARFARLAERGEEEVQRWIELGRDEELKGRDLARLAAERAMESGLGSLAQNKDVKKLVETQGTSLAGEVVEEVRERTVSGDALLEGWVRALLRRTPRSKLPPPPPGVRRWASRVREAKQQNRGR